MKATYNLAGQPMRRRELMEENMRMRAEVERLRSNVRLAYALALIFAVLLFTMASYVARLIP